MHAFFPDRIFHNFKNQNYSIDVSELQRILSLTNFQALKLRNVRSGSIVRNKIIPQGLLWRRKKE